MVYFGSNYRIVSRITLSALDLFNSSMYVCGDMSTISKFCYRYTMVMCVNVIPGIPVFRSVIFIGSQKLYINFTSV